MKLKYLAITASLCAAFFAACDDSGIAPKEHIAAYDTLPRFCEESDTVRLSSTGNLFYCNNGDWLEVGVIINKPKSSSSTESKPKSSAGEDIESSEDGDTPESTDSESSSSRRRDSSNASQDTSSDTDGDSSTSTGESSNSSTTTSSASEEDVAEPLAFLDEFCDWQDEKVCVIKDFIDPDQVTDSIYGKSYFNVSESIAMEGLDSAGINEVGALMGLPIGEKVTSYYSMATYTSHKGTSTTYYILFMRNGNTLVAGKFIGLLKEKISAVSTWPTTYSKGSLWNLDPNVAYQVQTPEVVACTNGAPFAMDDYGADCFMSTGGWWWASSAFIPKTKTSIMPATYDSYGYTELITTDPYDGSIIDNGNYVPGKGLRVALGAAGASSTEPGIVHIGFNWKKSDEPLDISAHGGFCVAYSWASTKATTPISLFIGWDSYENGDDNYYYNLPAGTHVVNIPWSKFYKDGWDTNQKLTAKEAAQISTSVMFRLSSFSTEAVSGTFHLASLGWYGECGSEY